MRTILAIALLAAASVSSAEAQRAINYPWCSIDSKSAARNCGFSTYQQCLWNISGLGGICERSLLNNPAPRRRARRNR